MSATLTVDDLQFEVRYSARRRSLEITVDRAGDLVLSAPEGVPPELVEDFVRKKRFWVYSKLVEKEVLRRPRVEKEFVSGEGFPYLGRTYRLLLVDEQDQPVKLERGRFSLPRAEQPRARQHFIDWYSRHARPWLERRLHRFTRRVGMEPRGLEIRDLGNRWASCGKGGVVNFHWASILLPPRIIDYVIVHELVHLIEDNHNTQFWRRVERAMPDFADRKRWLAEEGSGKHL